MIECQYTQGKIQVYRINGISVYLLEIKKSSLCCKIWVCASKASSKRLPLSPLAQNASKQCSEKQARFVSRRQSNNAHPGMDNETPESDKYWQMLHQLTEGMGASCLIAHTNRKPKHRAKPKSGSPHHQLWPRESTLIS